MIRLNSEFVLAALASAALATLGALPVAHAELVYEDSPSAAPAAPQQAARADDRSNLRQAIDSSERAQATNQAYAQQQVVSDPYAAPAAAAPVAVAPALEPAQAPVQSAVAGDSADDMRNMNRSELLRRQRVREELRNEDALQERLEALRLRDEKRRTDQILGNGANPADNSVSVPKPLYGAAAQDEVVAAPVTERPGQPAAVPQVAGAPNQAGIASTAVLNQQAAPSNQSTAANPAADPAKDKTIFSITPRAGIGGMSSNAGYQINPQFSAGVGVEVSTNNYLAIELGYTYAQYGVQIAPDNGFVAMAQESSGNTNTLTMNQNVFDAGVKLYLLDRDSAIRPFIGGGGGYAKSYINYNSQIINQINAMGLGNSNLASDYDVSQFLGYAEAGANVQMNKSISIGLMFRYYEVLSSSENGGINNYAFYNPGNLGASPSKQYVGGSVAGSGFYNILAGATFSF